jgi:hypothetical protein
LYIVHIILWQNTLAAEFEVLDICWISVSIL